MEEIIRTPEEVTLPCRETVLVIVDMQNDFAGQRGVFTTDRSLAVVSNIKDVIQKARENCLPIIYTQDYHKSSDWELRVLRRPPHAIEGTWGAEILDVIKPREEDFVVRKNSFDPWASGDQLEQILYKNLRNIRYCVVVGVYCEICVYATTNGFGIRGFELILPKDCTDGRTDYGRDLYFRQMIMIYNARLTDSKKLKFR